ncbi:MAG: hypothetical protein R3F55_01090 [Alphaproteobacteria bacterium]
MPLERSITALIRFITSPFPYDGPIPETGDPFLDVIEAGRRGHTAPRGGLLWEDEHYFDRRTLLYVPVGFDPEWPATLVVFFHGNDTTLERDVVARQRVHAQVEASGLNAILAAPQFAYDAPDSSAGGFWRPQAFRRWLAEVAEKLAPLLGDARLESRLDTLPVVLVAYSGGYNPAAFALSVGGADDRICGVLLLDALYDDEEAVADWVARRGDAFFISAYTASSQPSNDLLQTLLSERGASFDHVAGDPTAQPGSASFLFVDTVAHEDFVTRAWRETPIQWLLATLAEQDRCGA